jgi:putative PIG3 family NAD(P)H quinone oxidoreductase
VRAIVFDMPGDESVLRVGEAPRPVVDPGGVLIRVAAAGVNRADLLQRQGKYPSPPGASEILGLECAGTVIEVGGDGPFEPGDRVMALLQGGGYAELAAVDARCVLPVPEGMTLIEAAAIPETFFTVFLTVFQLAVFGAGDWLLAHGGGSGVGTAAITLARLAGGHVAVTAGSDAKCKRCLDMGAEVAANYRERDFAADLLAATNGRGVDVVLDVIGGPYLDRNLACLATGGRLVLIATMGGGHAPIDLRTLMRKRLTVIGSTLRARPIEERANVVAGFAGRFGAALAAGRIRPVVDRALPLERAGEAHRVVQASQHFGKVVLQVD